MKPNTGKRRQTKATAVQASIVAIMLNALLIIPCLFPISATRAASLPHANLQSVPRVEQTDSELIDQVSERLLAVISSQQKDRLSKYVWPPPFKLEKNADVNAYATLRCDYQFGQQKRVMDSDGRYFPFVVVTQPFMTDLIQGEPDRLALVLGHELSHILLGHLLPNSPSSSAQTSAMRTVFTADEEHDADLMGLKLALAAGYSIHGIRELWLRIMSDDFLKKHPGWDYSSFEGMGHNHPGWTDRLALIDKEKESLWKSMSAFENGVLFLVVQQYSAAELSFERVVADDAFPTSYEAWANLGYARLMEYFDGFDEKDLKGYQIGNVVTGSFYVRPESMRSQVRGINDKLWQKAVAALEKSLELNPDQPIAEANLGLAYLLNPTGKQDERALKYLENAKEDVWNDKHEGINPYNFVSLLINSAVAVMQVVAYEQAYNRLEKARSEPWAEKAFPAIKYNRALLLARSKDFGDQQAALSLMESYLESVSSTSVWWNLGYQHYVRMCDDVGIQPKSKSEFQQPKEVLRPITSVEIGKGKLITLSDPVDVVKNKLGAATSVPVAAGTNLVRLDYKNNGVELLAGRKVIAIFLRGHDSPAVQIRSLEAGSHVSLLRVGMTSNEVDRILVGRRQEGTLFSSQATYDFYPSLGLAVRYEGKLVKELVITQIAVQGS